MKLILLILGIVFLIVGVVALVATGFAGFMFYVPAIAIGLVCLFIRSKLS